MQAKKPEEKVEAVTSAPTSQPANVVARELRSWKLDPHYASGQKMICPQLMMPEVAISAAASIVWSGDLPPIPVPPTMRV